MSLAQGLINGCDDGLVVQDPVGILHPIFAKIIHLFGDQPVAKAALSRRISITAFLPRS